jgi:thiol-disulfide isomerase/thioredoxin
MLIQNITSYDDFNHYLKNYKYIIVNISAKWCKPCIALKPLLEKFVTVINEIDFIYLKLDNTIYENEQDFEHFFNLKKIPYFSFIKDSNIVNSFVDSNFTNVSKKLFDFIMIEKENEKKNYENFDTNDNF